MPPFQVRSFFNGTEVNKNCPGTGGRVECVHTVQLTKAGNNVVVLCFARNAGGGCRVKTLFITILGRTTGMYLYSIYHIEKLFSICQLNLLVPIYIYIYI